MLSAGVAFQQQILRLLVSVEAHWNPIGTAKPQTPDPIVPSPNQSGLPLDLRTPVRAPDKQKAAADAAAFKRNPG